MSSIGTGEIVMSIVDKQNILGQGTHLTSTYYCLCVVSMCCLLSVYVLLMCVYLLSMCCVCRLSSSLSVAISLLVYGYYLSLRLTLYMAIICRYLSPCIWLLSVAISHLVYGYYLSLRLTLYMAIIFLSLSGSISGTNDTTYALNAAGCVDASTVKETFGAYDPRTRPWYLAGKTNTT